VNCRGGKPGEGSGLLPFGNATFAAAVAANLLPPSVPFEYGSPPTDMICGLDTSLGFRDGPGCAVLIGASPGYDRFLSSLIEDGGGEM
jgi:hypothetical protein